MATYLRNSILLLLMILQGCALTGPVSENHGKRTMGTQIDDVGIAKRAKQNIKAAHADLDKAHIKVTVFNGVVLLTGQVSSKETKELAAKAARDLRKVKQVHNELEIAGPISFMARTNDSWLSTKVKTSLISDEEVEGGRIKVVTENGVVYLMGLLTRDEAAVQRAREVFGVQKIVKLFEYIN